MFGLAFLWSTKSLTSFVMLGGGGGSAMYLERVVEPQLVLARLLIRLSNSPASDPFTGSSQVGRRSKQDGLASLNQWL